MISKYTIFDRSRLRLRPLAERESLLGVEHWLGLEDETPPFRERGARHPARAPDGAALGAAGYRDFLVLAHTVERLEGGLVLSFGPAVMAPEVYLKALAMARNVARQEGREIRDFATAVFDQVPIQGDFRRELAKTDPGYYLRPHKTILVRTVAEGGTSYYFRGDHRATLPALRRAVCAGMSEAEQGA